MKCKICNGNLKYNNGLFVCKNCGSKQQLNSVYQNCDVFIAYIENDENGRRTKDSIISQDIYNNLKDLNITIFNERMSLDNVPLYQYEETIEIALNSSKVIIVVGTTPERLSSVLSRFQIEVSQIIIPVISQMKLKELPEQLLTLQAINYDNIGAVSDIRSSITKLLNLKTEYDVISSAKKYNNKKRKRIIMALTSFLIIASVLLIYYIFGTTYVLDSKKYEFGQNLLDDGDYIKAINQLSQISEYKNSQEMIDSIYDKYNGYFSIETSPITLHLNIDDNKIAKIEIIKNENNSIITAEAEVKIEENRIEFVYRDDQNNRGTGIITLLNEGLKLVFNTENVIGVSLGDCEQVYLFENRSDAPLDRDVTAKDLISWMNNHTTLQEIHKMGFQTEFIADLNPMTYSQDVYKITNTDYGVMISDFGRNTESVVGIYVPFEDVFPDTDFSYVPFTLEDNAFIPYKVYIGGAINFIYELGGIETDFLETTYFITSKEATVGYWNEIVNSISRLYDYNNSNDTEYYLKSTTSGSLVYNDLDEAVKAAIKYNFTLVDKNDKVVFIP